MRLTVVAYFAVAVGACLPTAQAIAAPALGAAEFEALVASRTFAFEADGEAYGRELYLSGRRVVWAFQDEPCREGVWHEPKPGQICFDYEGDPDTHCWAFRPGGGGLQAEFLGYSSGSGAQDQQPGNELPIIARPTAEPLICPGPDVGV